jgi:hypothetical protein
VADYETGRCADVPDQQLGSVALLADFTAVVSRMRDDHRGTGGDEWENPDLARFLDALAAVAEDWPHDEAPTWELFARLLVAATGYE